MTTLTVNSQLEHYSQLSQSFGSVSNFRNLYNQYYSNDLALYKLFQFPTRDIRILTDNNIVLFLQRSRQGVIDEDSILLEYPYMISNYKGELLYKVSDHNGIFGLNQYDQYLISNSNPLDFYILTYETHIGTKSVYLIINDVIEEIEDIQFTTKLATTPDLSNLYEGMNSLYLKSNSSFSISYIKKPISNFISESLIKNSNEVTVLNSQSNQLTWVIEESGWFLIEQNGNSVTYNSIRGLGIDRIIQWSNTNIYYVVIGSNYNYSYLKRLTGIQQFAQQSIQAYIEL